MRCLSLSSSVVHHSNTVVSLRRISCALASEVISASALSASVLYPQYILCLLDTPFSSTYDLIRPSLNTQLCHGIKGGRYVSGRCVPWREGHKPEPRATDIRSRSIIVTFKMSSASAPGVASVAMHTVHATTVRALVRILLPCHSPSGYRRVIHPVERFERIHIRLTVASESFPDAPWNAEGPSSSRNVRRQGVVML